MKKKYIISLKNRHFISCSHFELEKFEKGPKEIFDPDIQKDILVLEEQEVTKRIMQILLSLLINSINIIYDCLGKIQTDISDVMEKPGWNFSFLFFFGLARSTKMYIKKRRIFIKL